MLQARLFTELISVLMEQRGDKLMIIGTRQEHKNIPAVVGAKQ